MTQRLMLLDSASLYFRAFYGVPDQRRNPDEPPTNAVRGFLEMISTLVSTHRPTHLVACWDNDWRPAFRVNAIPTYKTHRLTEGSMVQEESPEDLTPQVPLIAEALQALGIARVGSDGYEADDVIGTLTCRARGQQLVDIVTGDRDLFQLVDDDAGVRVLYTARGGVRDPDVVTQSFLQSKYLVPTGSGLRGHGHASRRHERRVARCCRNRREDRRHLDQPVWRPRRSASRTRRRRPADQGRTTNASGSCLGLSGRGADGRPGRAGRPYPGLRRLAPPPGQRPHLAVIPGLELWPDQPHQPRAERVQSG